MPAAHGGALARWQPRAVAPVSREGHLPPAARPFRRSRLAWTAGWLSADLGRSAPGSWKLRRRPSGVRYLYILAVYLAAPLISLVMLRRGLRARSHWAIFRARL